MKKLLMVLLFAVGCSKTQTVVVETPKFDNTKNEQRLSALEAALQLNTTNDQLLTARVEALENADQDLREYIENSITNLNSELTTFINTQITTINSDTTSLTSRIAALESLNFDLSVAVNLLQNSAVTQVEFEAFRELVAEVYATKDMLEALDGRVDNLTTQVVTNAGDITSLQIIISGLTLVGSGVTIVKAPCLNATEVLLKVGNKYYADMNLYNGSGNSQVLTASYLTELSSNVNYKTTDGTNCQFRIVNGLLVGL